MNGRLAIEDDLKHGSAAFYLDNPADRQARPRDVALPRLARLVDDETGHAETVIVIQAEEYLDDPTAERMACLIGYRSADGTFGVCPANEIEWLEDVAG